MMLKQDVQRTFESFLFFGFLFLANASAFLGVIWLIPSVILFATILWIAWTVALIWQVYPQWRLVHLLPVLRINWFIVPFWLFSGLSILWSIDSQVSLQKWVILCCTLVAGGYIGLKYDLRRLVDLLCMFGLFILAASVALLIFVPDQGIMNYHSIQGAWRGIYWHKNHFGLIATFFNLLFLIRVVDGIWFNGGNKLAWSLIYICSLVFVIKSDSAAAYITTLFSHIAILLMLVWLKIRAKLHAFHYAAFLFLFVLGFAFLYANLDDFFGLFNRNTGLTGRVPMWSHLFEIYLVKHPWEGYGFNAFWSVEDHRVVMGRVAHYPDPIVIADNGFIDILMNSGYAGLTLFFVLYLGAVWRSLKHARKAFDMSGFFPLVLVIYVLLANLTWSLIFESEGFFMLLLIVILFVTPAHFTSTGDSDKFGQETGT